MRRDFSEKARQELLGLVKQVEDEQWCELTDWVGDRWIDFEGWIGKLDIRKYVDNVNAYHKKVIDKNDASAGDINKIFVAVNNCDRNYQTRFVAQLTDLQGFCTLLKKLTQAVQPSNGQLRIEGMGQSLKDSVSDYLARSRILQEIADDGLDEKEAAEAAEDPTLLQEVLDNMGSVFIALTPNVGVGQKFEMPIGPGMVFYYEVEGKLDKGSSADLNLVLEDQRIKIDNISAETGGLLSVGGEYSLDEEGKITINSENSNVEFNIDGSEVSGSGSVTVGNDKYTITITVSAAEITLEESVTTEVEGGSVTTKIGIRQSNNTWKPLPEPEVVTVPYPDKIPEFDVDWEEVGVVIGTVAVGTVVYIGLAYVTGGWSLLIPVPV